MLKKIFKFFKGYVIIEVTGKKCSRFMTMCINNGIKIYSSEPNEDSLVMVIARRDFKFLRRLVRKCGVRVKIKEKHGAVEFLKRNRYRYGFVIGMITCCIILLIIPHYIWCVEINGIYSSNPEKLTQVLREYGVYVGAKKRDIAAIPDIKQGIIHAENKVNWAWLYIDGAKARLEIQEYDKPPNVIDRFKPTDIIAACDGYVTKAVVTHGERRVNAGMTVSKGDVLVSGKVKVFNDGMPEKYIYVNSRAKITADTIRLASGKFRDTETLRIKTGRRAKRYSLHLFGREFKLWRDDRVMFDGNEYDTEQTVYDLNIPFYGYSGISVAVDTMYEVNVIQNKLTTEQMLDRAKEALEERICRRLLTGAVRTGEELVYDKVNEHEYEVRLRMRLKENIGMEVPTEE